ncbi:MULTISPECIES: HAMP domain-containing sensor histidine kinase [Pseudidiomarina]|uniref:histidine kinase n=2 Tax=Pseudidiomarina TaxID=2800384 RepID=A0A368USG4_9GAMM|nr:MULTISPECIES: sensor histidine kinase [Pseudidiomarina]PWW08884.1 histidine kinase/DNA gyrase B/HSP90-like ATPase [Pseudidiomarina maritima]RBP90140.1 histidine kinase/DNA gyrase B/HSP90-like ATPase [Pseudidiomarina tainanensis]RCW31746.1 histidine kinase/DNA gyrase B/HSP90-like ATPase [Pseudidiomarina tainanensis]
MNIEKLLIELRNLSPDKQIESLKALRETATTAEKKLIKTAAEDAGAPWLKNALLDIANSNNVRTNQKVEKPDPEEVFDKDAVKSEAVSDSIGQMIHELDPILGSIRIFAEREIDNFEQSKTKLELEKLIEVIEIFEEWRKAEQSPIFREVNIFGVISKEADRFASKSKVEIQIQVPKNLVCTTSSALLRIIISNALRNAVESSNQLTVREKHPIIVRGSATDSSIWFSVIDDGIGLQDKTELLLRSRHTTKPGNRGLGLAIIEKAVRSLGGQWRLSNSIPYGAELFFEIPRRD